MSLTQTESRIELPTQSSSKLSSPSSAQSNADPQSECLKPLERLRVSDGLLITADHWQRAHNYHRQHQSLQYQALYQSGIVWGLGISLTSAPATILAKYRDARWIQVKPGVAIDRLGNVIIVPEPMDFRIASEAPLTGNLTVYIVLRYVDPDQLQRPSQSDSQSEFVQETFRIDETTTLPQDSDVVLCRILLEPGNVTLQTTQNVFAPKANQLDLRDRRSVQAKSSMVVQVGTIAPLAENSWSEVLRSCAALYPNLQGRIQPISNTNIDLTSYDLLHFTQDQFVNLGSNEPELQSLKTAIESGTVLLIEASTQGTAIAKLGKLHHELQIAIQQTRWDSHAEKLKADLEVELKAITQDLNQHFNPIKAAIQTVITPLGLVFGASDATNEYTRNVNDGSLDRSHPLRRQPFLFSQFPIIHDHPIYLFNWGSIVLVVGDLSRSWNLQGEFGDDSDGDSWLLSRETLRSSHEMGINLLHFAALHHHLTQLQSLPRSLTPS